VADWAALCELGLLGELLEESLQLFLTERAHGGRE